MKDDPGAAFAAAAAALVGTAFRLHGRDPATGIDCVGLVASALRGCGRTPIVPEGYALRALDVTPLLRFAGRNGFAPVGDGPPEPGDLLLLRPGPVQAHLAIALGAQGFIHAHAGIGRVAIEAGSPAWPAAARWRLSREAD